MKNKIFRPAFISKLMILLFTTSLILHSQTNIISNPHSYELLNKYEKILELNNNVSFLKNREFLYSQNSALNKTLAQLNVPDSVVGKDFLGTKFKAIYQYSDHGQITMDLRQKWDGTGLVNSTRTTTAYNSNGQRTERLFENWDGSSWVINDKLTFTYDSNGNEIEELEQDWDGTQLVNDSRWKTEYTSEGKPSSIINEDWDGTAWIPDSRQTVTEQNASTFISIVEDWDGTNWINDSRSSTEFDANGRLISQLRQNWDGSDWVNRDRSSFTYNSNGYRTSFLSEEWNGTEWVNVQRYSYTFDANGLRTSWLFEHWDGSNWISDSRFVYTYDDNGNNIENLNEEWDGSQWIGVSRVSYTYDSNSNLIMGLSEMWENSSWVETPGSIGFSISDGSNLFLSYGFFAYSINVFYGSITDVESYKTLPTQFELSQNYPNPFNPSTTIEYSLPLNVKSETSNVKLVIYDILGRNVKTLINKKQNPGNYSVQFDGNGLSSGIYYYKLQTGNYVQTKKMILMK